MYPYVFVPEQLLPPLRLRRILTFFAIGLLTVLVIDLIAPGLIIGTVRRDDVAFIGIITLYVIAFGPKEIPS